MYPPDDRAVKHDSRRAPTGTRRKERRDHEVVTADRTSNGWAPLTRTDLEHLTDSELAQQLRGRVSAAHTFVFQKCLRLVQASSFRVLRSHAHVDDVVQRVFEELWRCPERFDPTRGSIDQYLAMQGRSRSIDLLRSEVSRVQREQGLGEAGRVPGPLEKMVGLDTGSDMKRWLDRLPFAERQVIQLAYFGQMTYREVAQLLELPDGTVKSRIRNGFVQLRSIISSETDGHLLELFRDT
jgi:RNA polymerase sigma-70 factor (ECF subfamily)